MKGAVMVTCERSARQNSRWERSFLMHEKM
jgi:hypothetical protein